MKSRLQQAAGPADRPPDRGLLQNSDPVLGVGDLLHPVDGFAVERRVGCASRHAGAARRSAGVI
jgi:hypothetical protein